VAWTTSARCRWAAPSLSPNSKFKLEWMQVHIGTSSSLIDHSAGAGVVQHQNLNVLSASYSVVY
jgi:hypothetical protein